MSFKLFSPNGKRKEMQKKNVDVLNKVIFP